jgi:hypothetical protein
VALLDYATVTMAIFPAMEEATTRTVIGNGCELDSRFRSLFYRERAGRVHVRLHAAGMRGIHFYPRAAQHLGQVNGEGVDAVLLES